MPSVSCFSQKGGLSGKCLSSARRARSDRLRYTVALPETHGVKTGSSRLTACASSETVERLKVASARVNDRVKPIYEKAELDAALERAGDRLVVLELMKDTECDTGLFEEREDHWKTAEEQHRAKMQECLDIRSLFVEMAATSLSARFYRILEDEDEPSDVAPALGISMFPAVVFFKNKKVVWMRQGSHGMKSDLAEGILALGGKQYVTSAHVAQLTSERDFDKFVVAKTAKEQHLKVIMMSSYMCSPCVHAYPYFVALSASFKDFEFARMEGDDEAMGPVFEKLNILEVPTLLVYNKDGKEVSRLISSDPSDIVGFIIDLSAKMGFKIPSKSGR